MVSQAICYCYDIGFKVAMDFTDDRMLRIDFFRVENTCKSLLLLIEVDSRIMLIKSELFPLP